MNAKYQGSIHYFRVSGCGWQAFHIGIYITHENIPVILLVNTTSRDIKYYAYIPISLVLRDKVDILPISPMSTLIMWLPWRLLVLVFTDSDQNFWCKLYQIENLWSKLVSDGDLKILLNNSDDVNTNELVKYVVTHSLEVYRWQWQCSWA